MGFWCSPSRSKQKRAPRLSAREAEIIYLLAQGLTNKEIAEHESVSPETVKTSVAHLLKKLEARNRTNAAVKAAAAGLLSLEEFTTPPGRFP